MAKNKGGRPPKITKDVLLKLEEAFSNDATDLEACFLAGITKTTLYKYQEKHPEFADRKAALKDMTKYQAKSNVSDAVEKKDRQTSQWYLERKGRGDGYGNRHDMDVTSKGEKISGFNFVEHEADNPTNSETADSVEPSTEPKD